MFDLPPQELCEQVFNRQKSMISQLPSLSSTLWNVINLCFISTPLFDCTQPFGPNSPDYHPCHHRKSFLAWSHPSFTSRRASPAHIPPADFTALLADVRDWESRNTPFYYQEHCPGGSRLAALVRVSGKWKISRWVCSEMEEARRGLEVYDDWKEEDGEGAQVCEGLLEDGLEMVKRGVALLKEAGASWELSGEETEEEVKVLLTADRGGGDGGWDTEMWSREIGGGGGWDIGMRRRRGIGGGGD